MSAGDTAQAVEGMGIVRHGGQAGLVLGDSMRWRPSLRVEKYAEDQVAFLRQLLKREPTVADLERLCKPYEVVVSEGNLLTTAGLQRMGNLLIGAGGQALTNTACRIGVGNSTTAEAVGQTDLSAAAGAANRQFKVMDATFPTAVGGVWTWKSSFATGEANFVWNEWGIDVGTPTVTDGTTVNALLLNRKVQSLGTKVSGVWVATATVTVT